MVASCTSAIQSGPLRLEQGFTANGKGHIVAYTPYADQVKEMPEYWYLGTKPHLWCTTHYNYNCKELNAKSAMDARRSLRINGTELTFP